MSDKSLKARWLWLAAIWMFSLAINAQTEQFEVEIGDRLYAFETARIHQDFDAMLDLTYPELFSLIDRKSLKERLALLATEPSELPETLTNFKVEIFGDPIETRDRIFLRVRMNYDGSNDQSQRRILAIRNNDSLTWYFLEIGNGQNALFSSLIPDALLR